MSQFLTVKAVSKLSGVSAHTLRAWERRYQAVTPRRTDNGRRFYTNDDVERLKLLNQLVNSGYAIGGIAKFTDKELLSLTKTTQASSVPPLVGESSESSPALVDELLDALSGFEIDKLSKTLNHARVTFPVKSFVLDVISPLMGFVGQKVAAGKLSIAQEHMLSAIVRDHLGQILQSLSQSNLKPKTFLFSTREGDIHEFGILLSSILCVGHGFKAHYLGPNIPAKDLIETSKKLNADAIVIGTVPIQKNADAVTLTGYLKKLDQEIRTGVQIIVGGMLTTNETLPKSKRVKHITSLHDFDNLLATT